tara:strand:- start:4324 stop:4605 length:282 start_codon:yes stop_codon:yes gene_type:complete
MSSIVSKPDWGIALVDGNKATSAMQEYLDDISTLLNSNLLGAQVALTSYTVATVPTVTSAPGMIYVSDETGGAVMAFSDGTNWRRCTDRAIIS